VGKIGGFFPVASVYHIDTPTQGEKTRRATRAAALVILLNIKHDLIKKKNNCSITTVYPTRVVKRKLEKKINRKF